MRRVNPFPDWKKARMFNGIEKIPEAQINLEILSFHFNLVFMP